MDKQQFLDKWKIKNIDCIADIDAVIATEIAKAKEQQPVETEKPSSQVKLDNSFDKERFEAMFRAIVASGVSNDEFITTEGILEELDAYYATKEKGGNDG